MRKTWPLTEHVLRISEDVAAGSIYSKSTRSPVRTERHAGERPEQFDPVVEHVAHARAG